MGEKQTILAEADSIVNGQRRKDYGGPLESFEDIAKGWAMVLGIPVTAEQVGLCMIQLKVARAKNGGFHRDSFVDIAGYAQCMEFIADERADEKAREALEPYRVSGPSMGPLRYRHDDNRVCEESSDPAGWFIATPEGGSTFSETGSWCSRAHGNNDPGKEGQR